MNNRRKLITGLATLIVAPAIVRIENLMSIQGERYFFWQYTCPILPPIIELNGISVNEYLKKWLSPNGKIYKGVWTFYGKDRNIYSDKQIAFYKEEYND